VKRYPAYDPPEYIDWTPDPKLVESFEETLARNETRHRLVASLRRDQLMELYRRLLRARLHDIALQRWVRQGVISKAWLGTGEEAATVGPVFALEPRRDYAAPMIRNQAACCDMGLPLEDMFRAYLASADSPSAGRDLHVGSEEHHVLQPVSPVGTMVPVAAGLALAARMLGQSAVILNWIGDGSTKAGVVHEGLNLAAVAGLPVIFIIQNNQVALGTRLDQHHVAPDFADWPAAYGVEGWGFDGNNVLDAYAATHFAIERCRLGEGPVLLQAETFRMGGHATHDEREARETFPVELFDSWGKRDPIGLYEEYLKRTGVSAVELEAVEHDAQAEVDGAAERAFASRASPPSPESALEGVYARE
jgi:TPP-dependent pyruvate/acetoin dehydrogenase alpha subunit